MERVLRNFGTQQYEADLRTIAVSHYDSITLVHNGCDVATCLARGTILVQHAHVLAVLNQ